jgi:hypothetical protein
LQKALQPLCRCAVIPSSSGQSPEGVEGSRARFKCRHPRVIGFCGIVVAHPLLGEHRGSPPEFGRACQVTRAFCVLRLIDQKVTQLLRQDLVVEHLGQRLDRSLVAFVLAEADPQHFRCPRALTKVDEQLRRRKPQSDPRWRIADRGDLALAQAQ